MRMQTLKTRVERLERATRALKQLHRAQTDSEVNRAMREIELAKAWPTEHLQDGERIYSRAGCQAWRV